MIDIAAGGTPMRKTPEKAYELLKEMTSNSYQWQSEWIVAKKPTGVHEVDTMTVFAAQLEALSKKIDSMATSSMSV